LFYIKRLSEQHKEVCSEAELKERLSDIPRLLKVYLWFAHAVATREHVLQILPVEGALVRWKTFHLIDKGMSEGAGTIQLSIFNMTVSLSHLM